MRRNVLHLIDTGGPGGAETIYLNLVEGLDRERWRSVATVPWLEWLSGELVERGIEPCLLSTQGSFDFAYLRRLHQLVRRERIDLIHAHLLTSSVYGSAVARLSGVPVVSTFHGQVDISAAGAYGAVKFRLLNRRRNRTVFVSESLRRTLLAATSLDPANARVIHNGIDAQQFRPGRDDALRRELGIGPDEVLIGAVGNIRPAKAYDVLLRAAALLRDRGQSHHLVIVGDAQGALYEELVALRRDLGLERTMHFTGFRSDIHRVLPNFDLYVLSSSAEGFSLSTVQALACGLPVVATRCGGPEEIIADGETGMLVAPNSPPALAGALGSLIRDPERRQRLAGAGRESVVARFSVESMVRSYAALYEECLCGSAHPAERGPNEHVPSGTGC